MNMPRFDIRQAEDGSRSIVIDGPSGERPIRISLSERQAGFGTDVANLVASLVRIAGADSGPTVTTRRSRI